MFMRNCTKLVALVVALLLPMMAIGKKEKGNDMIIGAYVTSWTNEVPDPLTMTHLNYAFGHVNETFNGLRIDNPERLRMMVGLKAKNPELKVVLSVGGWGSGRFSEMAADANNRMLFAKDCKRAVEEFGLDGIDIDWEYPTQSSANISSSPEDTQNFTLLMRDLRKALGKQKLLTAATVCNAKYIDFKACLQYMDFVNVMAYDMGGEQKHHASLFPSKNAGYCTSSQAVEAHLKAGVPREKLVMGIPFYGKGRRNDEGLREYNRSGRLPKGYERKWDSEGRFPYITNAEGLFVWGYENTRSLAEKCQYILDNNLRGGMYWDYASDNPQGDERTTLYLSLPKNKKGTEAPRRVLVLAERGGLHEGFTARGLQWLQDNKEKLNLQLTILNSAKEIKKGELETYHLILQLNYPPYSWSEAAQQDLQAYINHGTGGYIGFHHATLLGDFDGYEMWPWFSDFMGKIRYRNYVAETCDGTVQVEDWEHPVMKGVSQSFVVKEDEWYTYEQNPRPNVHVLAKVDEDSYTTQTTVKMGDHPVIWSNERVKARNVYFQFGHSAKLFENAAFLRLFENALHWTLKDDEAPQENSGYAADYARGPRFKALLHYEPHAEEAHVTFDKQAIQFFHKLTYGEGWTMDVTTSLADYPLEKLKDYSIIISLNAMPGGKEQREAFEQYMKQGGGWIGFHASAYNDKNTNWPWLNEFLGCGPFYCNNWPPQPALVETDAPEHTVMKTLPASFVIPASEFYQWDPSPRKNKDVEVLLSISPKMYPFGLKDVVKWGDFPIVWTNKKYRMVYLNMGHGDEEFIDATQNLLFVNAFRWVVSRDPKGDPFKNK
jgi:chitinase